MIPTPLKKEKNCPFYLFPNTPTACDGWAVANFIPDIKYSEILKMPRPLRRLGFLFLLFLLFLAAAYAEVEESKILVEVIIPEGYKKVEAGSSLLTQAEIIILEKEYNGTVTDVPIEYSIKNRDEATIVKISETKGIRERISTVKELIIPTDALPGVYTLEVKARYNGKIGTDTVLFEVAESQNDQKIIIKKLQENFTVLASILVLVALFFLIYLWSEYRKFKRLGKQFKIGVKDLKEEDIWR